MAGAAVAAGTTSASASVAGFARVAFGLAGTTASAGTVSASATFVLRTALGLAGAAATAPSSTPASEAGRAAGSAAVTTSAAAAAFASATETSLRMSIRQPVSFAAETGVLALFADGQGKHPFVDGDCGRPVLFVYRDVQYLRRCQGVGHEQGGIGIPRDDVDLLGGQLVHDVLDARAPLADGAPTGSSPSWRLEHGHLGPRAGLAGDRFDLDGPGVDLRDFELEETAQKVLVGPADEQLGPADASPDLEDEDLIGWPIR